MKEEEAWRWWSEGRVFVLRHFFSPSAARALAPKAKMERMESMEPITAHYTTSYPEIQPDSGFHSRETTDSLDKTPAPVYDEELVHKVGTRVLFCLVQQYKTTNFTGSPENQNIFKIRFSETRH